MAEPKPLLEGERASAYQRALSDIMEEVGSLEALAKESNYEKIPEDEALDPILQKLADLDMTLADDHPLRQQHAVQEHAAWEIVETLKKKNKLRDDAKTKESEDAETFDSAQTQRFERPSILDPAKTQQLDKKDIPVVDFEIPPELDYVKLTKPKTASDKAAEAREQVLEAIEKKLARLEQELSVASEKGDDDTIRNGLDEAHRLTQDIYALKGSSDKAKALERRLAELNRYEKGQQPSAKQEKSSASAAWMPRVPVAPYRRMGKGPVRKMATLAVAPAAVPAVSELSVKARPMPAVPADIASKSEDEKLAYLEQLLTVFQTEHKRLIDEHNALVMKLTEQVKERKLQALRDSLK